MNYLAHVFLTSHSPEMIIGGLLGDFVKGTSLDGYNGMVRHSILLHRKIDRYTDAHNIVRSGRDLVAAPRRRFAPIMIDVFYDHFLARHWRHFAATPLAEFTTDVYGILKQHRASLPERLQRVLPHMCQDDWLGSYRELDGIDAALNGIARRFKRFGRAQVLHDAIDDLQNGYCEFEEQFLSFFPQLMHYVNGCVEQLTDATSTVWRAPAQTVALAG